MVIPFGYGQALYSFTGTALPLGAAMTFGFYNAGDFNPQQLATFFRDAWDAHWKPRNLNSVTLSATRVKLGPNESGAMAEVSSNIAGALNSPAASPNVAKLVRKISSEGGRWSRGRSYWPGVGELQIDGAGNIDAPTLTADQSAATAFYDLCVTNNSPLVILHAGPPAPPRAPTPVSGLQVDGRVATQRRRLRR
jgi:hypothetical protein